MRKNTKYSMRLIIAIVLISLAVITQTGVLVAMYLLTRRMAGKAETLMNESQKLMAPLESIANDLKTVAADLAETGKIARSQALHVQEIVTGTRESIRQQIADVRTAVRDTVSEARNVAMRPVREYSAIAMGIAAGIRSLFNRKRPSAKTGASREAQPPAA